MKPKNEPNIWDFMRESAERYDREHPIIDTRYFVVETTPMHTIRIPNGDGHGGSTYEDIPKTSVRVSDYTKDKEACQKFIDDHEPDEGKVLEISYEHLREHTTRTWGE